MFKKPRLLLFISILLLALSTPLAVHACIPSGPDPWFSTSITIDNSTLPPGVEIILIDPNNVRHALTNRSNEPLYIVKENSSNWRTFPNSELPGDYEPIYKIVDGKSFYYINDQFSKPPWAGYKPNYGGTNNSSAISVEISGYIYALDGGSKQIAKDDRPVQVEIPSPQTFTILSFYQNKPLLIKGTLTYSLNNKYDPKAGVNGAEACNNWWNSTDYFTIIYSIVIVSAPWIFLLFLPVVAILFFRRFIKR